MKLDSYVPEEPEKVGYIGDLRTMTSGRGQFSMEFSHCAPTPKNVSDDVIAKAKAKAKDEAHRAAK